MPTPPPDHHRPITVLALGATLATASALIPRLPRQLRSLRLRQTDTSTQPVSNAPHSDNSGMASDVDVSIVRKPGGTGNNCVDSGDDASDFVSEMPAVPRSSASAPTP